MELRLRATTPADADALIPLIRAYYVHDHIPYEEAAIRRGLAELWRRPELGQALLVQADGHVVGHLVLSFGFDLEFGGPQATVTELYLLPERRGGGLGRQVLDAVDALLRARGIATLELQVERENAAARAFYSRLGFQAHDRVPLSRPVAPAPVPLTARPELPERPVGMVQSYDRLAPAYARALLRELDGKPLDRALLANLIVEASGPILEVGCGPGQISRFLADHGADVVGSDLSPGMVELARRLHPHLRFVVADMGALPFPPGSVAAIVAFYAIVHLRPEALAPTFAAMLPVLRPGGRLLLAFHIGDERVHTDELFGEPVDLDFQFHRVEAVQAALAEAGFALRATTVRAPYPGAEHPSTRAYLLAARP